MIERFHVFASQVAKLNHFKPLEKKSLAGAFVFFCQGKITWNNTIQKPIWNITRSKVPFSLRNKKRMAHIQMFSVQFLIQFKHSVHFHLLPFCIPFLFSHIPCSQPLESLLFETLHPIFCSVLFLPSIPQKRR